MKQACIGEKRDRHVEDTRIRVWALGHQGLGMFRV